MNTHINVFSKFVISSSKESIVPTFTALQKRIIAIASICFACLVTFYALRSYWFVFHGKNSPNPKQDQRLEPNWINAHPGVSLKDLGLIHFDAVEDFLKEHGKQLYCLNLAEMDLNDDQFEQLILYCPNLDCLHIESDEISDKAIQHLRGMPLTSLSFSRCHELTDHAIENLKRMPLTNVDFSECEYLTDQSIDYLKRMSLTSVNFSYCGKLTDQALEYLKGMPLTSVSFRGSRNLTDQGLEHLKGMPLTSVDFSYCRNLTDQALEHLKRMPLTRVNFTRCCNLTDQAFMTFKKQLHLKSKVDVYL